MSLVCRNQNLVRILSYDTLVRDHTLGNTVEELDMLCHEKWNSSNCPKVTIFQYTPK